MQRTLRYQQLGERLSTWLPVLLMALLALGTWFLVRYAPRPQGEGAQPAPSHEPDYYMRDFSIARFDATGRLASQLHGSMLRHYPDTDTLEIEHPRMLAISPEGQRTHAQALRALSSGDGSQVQLLGQAQVTREAFTTPLQKVQPRLHFAGEHLHIWPDTQKLRSEQPVTLTRGADHFSADSMQYDHEGMVLQLRGRVRGSLQATPTAPKTQIK